MQVGHELGLVRMQLDEVVIHVARMARGIAEPLDVGDLREPLDELGQRPGRSVRPQPMIGVHVLAEQGELA